MSREYKCLSKNKFEYGNFSIIPIRDIDKYQILKWRNEQISILRQKQKLSEEQQLSYFKNVVDKLFETHTPNQLLFSFFENEEFIGYGGLVHIDWESKNAEVSFLLDTDTNNKEHHFKIAFEAFLKTIEKLAFEKLNFKKIHTTCYDINERVSYIQTIKKMNFEQEAFLKEHVFINDNYSNVLIFSKFNTLLNCN